MKRNFWWFCETTAHNSISDVQVLDKSVWKYVMMFFMRSKPLLEKAIIKAVKSSIPKLGNCRIKVVFHTFVQLSLYMCHDKIFNYMIRCCGFLQYLVSFSAGDKNIGE